MLVRRFKPAGIDIFKERILAFNKDDEKAIDLSDLLEDSSYTSQYSVKIDIQTQDFNVSYKLGKYLSDIFDGLDTSKLMNDVHLWNWLSCYFFDLITINKKTNSREIGELKRYIFDSSSINFYKHHIFSSWYFYHLYREKSKIILNTPVWGISKVSRLIVKNKYIINYPLLIDVIYELYWNFKTSKAKKNYLNERMPGNITRFPSVLNQLMLTYDIFSLSSDEILKILPSEFDGWKQADD